MMVPFRWSTMFQSGILLVLSYFSATFACSPPEGIYKPPLMEEKIYYSELVAYGKAVGRIPHEFYEDAYTAEFKVYCTYKGDMLPQKINITDAGYVPGLCHSTTLEPGQEYFVFLRDDEGIYRPTYSEEKATDQIVDDIPIYCNLLMKYPKGVSAINTTKYCPEAEPDYPGCIEYTTPPPTEPPTPPTLPTAPPRPNNLPEDSTRKPPIPSPKIPGVTPQTEIKIVASTVSNKLKTPDAGGQGHTVIETNPEPNDGQPSSPQEPAVAGIGSGVVDDNGSSCLMASALIIMSVIVGAKLIG